MSRRKEPRRQFQLVGRGSARGRSLQGRVPQGRVRNKEAGQGFLPGNRDGACRTVRRPTDACCSRPPLTRRRVRHPGRVLRCLGRRQRPRPPGRNTCLGCRGPARSARLRLPPRRGQRICPSSARDVHHRRSRYRCPHRTPDAIRGGRHQGLARNRHSSLRKRCPADIHERRDGATSPARCPAGGSESRLRWSSAMTAMPTPSEHKAADTSLGDLLGEVIRDVSTLLRQEVEWRRLKCAPRRPGRERVPACWAAPAMPAT